ncbi:ABC transporter ATP-binding protein [Thermococcus sp. AM4]|uniref:ABC transporter ATP-binding protein n=1 Tax=Thermococcus sp. (strain AM4) TaxID=246969 RepID=UPI001ED932FA|nr:ABC transporter ATP-binding protein [Thermococcus sp. AM4]
MSKSYGRVKALKGVTFSLSRGLSLILGPNGSGKTTLIKILAGIIKPDEGDIRVLKRDYLSVPKNEIGFAFERTVAPPRIQVESYLRAVAEYRGTDNVDELLDLFGLRRYRTKKFKELSQGYKRRFLVATAFAGKPKAVFLDEPFSNLDIVSKVELGRAFQEIKREVSIVIVSHIISGLKNLDSLVLLHNGEVVLNKVGREVSTVGGFKATFKDGTVVENDVNMVMKLIRKGKELLCIDPITPEDIMYEKLKNGKKK